MPDNIKRGVSYTAGAQLIAMGIQFANTIVLARSLAVTDYGLYNLFFSASLTSATVVDLGINAAITRFVAESDTEGKPERTFSVINSGLTIHGLMFLVLIPFVWIFGQKISETWFDSNALIYGLFIITVPVVVWTGDLIASLYGLRELKYVAIRMLLQAGFLFFLNILLIQLLNQGLVVAAAIYLFTNLVLLIWLISHFARAVKAKRLLANWHYIFRPLILFALPLAVVYAMQVFISYAPLLVTKAIDGNATNINHQIAVVSLAMMLGSAVNNVLSTAVKSGYGYITQWYIQKRFRLFRKYIVLIQAFIVVIYALAIVLGIVALPRIVEIVFGNEYSDTPQYFTLVLLSALMSSSTTLYNSVLYSMNKTKSVMWATGLQFVVYLWAIFALFSGWSAAFNVSSSLLVVAVISGLARNIVLIALSFRHLHTAIEQTKFPGNFEITGIAP